MTHSDTKQLDDNPTFWEVDNALYEHERPFYRYCAQGAGSNPNENPAWVSERERLIALWHKLYPNTNRQHLHINPDSYGPSGEIET